MRTYFYQLLPATTGVGNLVSSSAQKIDYTLGYSVQAVWTGGLNGNIYLNASNDGVIFDQIAGSQQSIQGSSSFMWNVSWANYDYMQIQYQPTSASSGTLSATFYSKGF